MRTGRIHDFSGKYNATHLKLAHSPCFQVSDDKDATHCNGKIAVYADWLCLFPSELHPHPPEVPQMAFPKWLVPTAALL